MSIAHGTIKILIFNTNMRQISIKASFFFTKKIPPQYSGCFEPNTEGDSHQKMIKQANALSLV